MTENLENAESKTELRLDVGIGEDGPYPAVVTLMALPPDPPSHLSRAMRATYYAVARLDFGPEAGDSPLTVALAIGAGATVA